MSKLVTLVLAAAAFSVAAYFVVSGRPVPSLPRERGMRRNFLIAVGLFAALLAAGGCGKKKTPEPMCYETAQVGDDGTPVVVGISGTLREIWRTLDRDRTKEFGEAVDREAEAGKIRERVADMLKAVYDELSDHRFMTSGKVTCYEPTITGNTVATSRGKALLQIDLLARAREKGTLDEATASLAVKALATEIERMYMMRRLTGADLRVFERQILKSQVPEVKAGDAAHSTAALIVTFEGGKPDFLEPGKRLAVMKERVQALLEKGPPGNDWQDPDIDPNVNSMLTDQGLLPPPRARMSCYDRFDVPTPARSEELKSLQKELLDEKVEAGILPVEVAEKAKEAVQEDGKGEASERDVLAFQKKVRRAVRLLYKHGELTSDFVGRLENTIGADLIAFDAGKALKNDVSYHLRTCFAHSPAWVALDILTKGGIVKKARSRRGVMRGRGEPGPEVQKKLVIFRELLKNSDRIDLPGGEGNLVRSGELPKRDLEYRLSVRRACRALVKSGAAAPSQLASVEEILKIPLLGSIEGK